MAQLVNWHPSQLMISCCGPAFRTIFNYQHPEIVCDFCFHQKSLFSSSEHKLHQHIHLPAQQACTLTYSVFSSRQKNWHTSAKNNQLNHHINTESHWTENCCCPPLEPSNLSSSSHHTPISCQSKCFCLWQLMESAYLNFDGDLSLKTVDRRRQEMHRSLRFSCSLSERYVHLQTCFLAAQGLNSAICVLSYLFLSLRERQELPDNVKSKKYTFNLLSLHSCSL